VTLLLGIGTSSPALSVALFADGVRLACEHRLIGRGHAEALVPAIAALMAGRRADAIVVDIGPGSFTGIRVGIAAARALGLAWNVPVTGVMASTLVAAAAFAEVTDLHAVRVQLEAGRGQHFVQTIDRHYRARELLTLDLQDLPSGPGFLPAGAGAALALAGPDMAVLPRVPPALRALAPQAHYVRPPDAGLTEQRLPH
jgi:tRNA threonylcarbamoyladenosine biosynthesis protein TsaB